MSSKLHVPFGLNGSRLYEPLQVPNGKLCGCLCPACKRPLIAKQRALTPHFAHAPGYSCEYGLETAIHLAAKQIISDLMEVRIPAVKFLSPYADGQSKTISSEKIVRVDSVDLEVWLVDLRPDIIVKFGDERYLVEIAATHFVDEVKRGKIRRHGISAFEVEVSSVSKTFTFKSLTHLLFLASYPAVWLHNGLIDELAAQDEAAHLRAAVAKEAFRKSNLASVQAKELYESQKRAEKFHKYKAFPAQRKLEINMQALKLSLPQIELFSTRVPWGDSFGVPNNVWQSTVLVYVAREVSNMNRNSFVPNLFNAEVCLSRLRHCFDVTSRVKNGNAIAVFKYLKHLEDMGILKYRGRKEFELVVSPDKWPKLKLRDPFEE